MPGTEDEWILLGFGSTDNTRQTAACLKIEHHELHGQKQIDLWKTEDFRKSLRWLAAW